MDFRNKIRQEAMRRGIRYLVHFTQLGNLPSIVAHGLLSRMDLVARNLITLTSDPWRLDEKYEATSVSVSAMNYEMFKAKQYTCGRTAWVVLFLDSSILWTHGCRFYRRNAAKKEMKRHREGLDGDWRFRQMFSDEILSTQFKGAGYRAQTNIPDFLTTYPDAEVQVFEPIASETILGAWVERCDWAEAVLEELNQLPGPERDVVVREFKPRFFNGYSEWG